MKTETSSSWFGSRPGMKKNRYIRGFTSGTRDERFLTRDKLVSPGDQVLPARTFSFLVFSPAVETVYMEFSISGSQFIPVLWIVMKLSRD